jgi:hypothetical protein
MRMPRRTAERNRAEPNGTAERNPTESNGTGFAACVLLSSIQDWIVSHCLVSLLNTAAQRGVCDGCKKHHRKLESAGEKNVTQRIALC